MAKAKKFSKSKELVEKLLTNLGIDEINFAVFDIWEKEAGMLARHAEIAGIKNGTVIVRTMFPSCYQELLLVKSQLIKKMNGHFGKNIIHDIKVITSNEQIR